MCRYDPITKTERRCPSYLDRERYNAKRRARYHAQKQGSSFTKYKSEEDNNFSLSSAQNKTFSIDKNLPIFKIKVSGFNISSREESEINDVYEVSDDSTAIDDLNIIEREVTGDLIKVNYFNNRVYQGQFNYENLNEDSYKNFFAPVEDSLFEYAETFAGRTTTTKIFQRQQDGLIDNLDSIESMSVLEVENMSEEEKSALNFFTTGNYKWFNEAIYSSGKNLTPVLPDEHEDILQTDNFTFVQQSPKNAEKMVGLLDSALSKGPKVQRTLYRGVNSDNPMFKNSSATEWLEKLSLGKEIKFDGYQSSSQNFDIAKNYASGVGIMFEIITPEGVQISSCSNHTDEMETLLPRDTRYSVVGLHKELVGSENSPHGVMSVVQLIAINNKGEILDGTNSDPLEPIFKKEKY